MGDAILIGGHRSQSFGPSHYRTGCCNVGAICGARPSATNTAQAQ